MGEREDTPAANLTEMVQRDHFALKAVTLSVQDLTKEVRGYRDDTNKGFARLDQHILTCDRRYTESRDARQNGNPALEPKTATIAKRITKKITEKLVDYVLFAIVVLIVFAFKHGASLPMPSP